MAKPITPSNQIPTVGMGQAVSDMKTAALDNRRTFERRWYDNNFFDDGYHFRYLSRTTNKIIDLTEKSAVHTPTRAIPKASRQIRGLANLLMNSDPVPVVYPEKVSMSNYPGEPGQPNPKYDEALKEAKMVAQKTGHWITEEFKDQDILRKLTQMVILAAKHGVSYMQIWPDAVDEAIRTQVYDAFDIFLDGTLTNMSDSPFVLKATPMHISKILANENFDEEQRQKITADNRQAGSQIKESYMNARYGRERESSQNSTAVLDEIFIKEYLDDNNKKRIEEQEDGEKVLKGKKNGDMVIRHTSVANQVWLRDVYVDVPDYPFVDYRFEPGQMYQVPPIERFIPSNKSLDVIVSRVERFANTMVTGTWLKKQGEQFELNNVAGGQVIEYNGTPPIPGQVPSIPPFVFDYIGLLNSFIEEQGVTTTTLGKLPSGVKAASAIESLKQSEFANLVIAQRQLKDTTKQIAEKFINIADDYFVSPKTIQVLEKGEPQYFDLIGATALEARKELKIETPSDVIPIKKDYKVDIQIESGLGFTKEGQKQTMLQLAEYMRSLAQEGLIPPQAVQSVVRKLLETYQFGSTEEFMESLEGEGSAFTEQQIEAIKVAVAEVIKDLKGSEIFPDSTQRVEENKVAFAEGVKDFGLKDKPEPEKPPSRSISFKDLPPEGAAQLAGQAGISIQPQEVASERKVTSKPTNG